MNRGSGALERKNGQAFRDLPDEEIEALVRSLNSLHEGELGIDMLVARGERAIAPLRRFLLEGNPSGIFLPRRRAVRALAELGAKEVLLDYLLLDRHIQHPVAAHGEEAVRNTAARALAHCQTEDVYQALRMVLARRRLSGVIEALGEFRRPEVLPELVAALEDDFCRSSAEDALRKMGELAHGVLIEAARTPDPSGARERPASQRRRRCVLRLLESLPLGVEDWRQLAALLHDQDPEIAARAAAIASMVADEPDKNLAVKRLIEVLPAADWLLQGEIEAWLSKNVDVALPEISKEIDETTCRASFGSSGRRCSATLAWRKTKGRSGHEVWSMKPAISEFIFDREEERQRIDQFLVKRRPFLIFGPSGVGKTLLLRSVLPEFRSVLYCEDSSTTNVMFRSLALSLIRLGSPRAKKAFRDEDSISAKSAVSLKGIVMDALREGEHSIVLDHLKRPSYAFAAAVREVMGWGSTPVNAVARSSHMEDTGFLQPLYGDRSQKCEIRNFDAATAEQFACERVKRSGLSGTNISEFIEKVLEFSAGNPGTIIRLIDMATHPKYRSDEHIKISPLYIDFRMNGGVVR